MKFNRSNSSGERESEIESERVEKKKRTEVTRRQLMCFGHLSRESRQPHEMGKKTRRIYTNFILKCRVYITYNMYLRKITGGQHTFPVVLFNFKHNFNCKRAHRVIHFVRTEIPFFVVYLTHN